MGIPRFFTAGMALTLALAPQALAQNRGAAMVERQQAFVDSAVVVLELPTEQEMAFRAIMTEQLESLQAIFEKYAGQRDPRMRDEVLALREATDAKLETVLDEEQMKAFVTLRDEHRAQFRRNRQAPSGG